MTLLSVCQEVAKVVALTVPTAVAASTTREHVELIALANEMAERIAAGHEWQKLALKHTLTGDSSTVDFNMPDDYDRMPVDGQVWSSALETPMTHILSLNEWLGMEVQTFDLVLNAWIIYGDQMHIKPALSDGVTAKFFYQSNKHIVASNGTTFKNRFDADNDSFRLDETLLKLGMIWQWRANKGVAYDEDMVNYETLLARKVLRDKGAKTLVVGRQRLPADVSIAYPQAIIPA